MLSPSLVILSPSLVTLSEAKGLQLLRVNSAEDLSISLRVNSAKHL